MSSLLSDVKRTWINDDRLLNQWLMIVLNNRYIANNGASLDTQQRAFCCARCPKCSQFIFFATASV